MKNKIILILLTIFIVGSITSITAYSSLSQEDKYDSVGKVKKDTQISVHVCPMPITNSILYHGCLRDEGGHYLSNKPITISADNGETWKTKTSTASNGGFRYQMLGEIPVTVKFAGDKNYNPCENSTNIWPCGLLH